MFRCRASADEACDLCGFFFAAEGWFFVLLCWDEGVFCGFLMYLNRGVGFAGEGGVIWDRWVEIKIRTLMNGVGLARGILLAVACVI